MRHGFRNSCPNNICKKNPVRKPKQKTGCTGKKGTKMGVYIQAVFFQKHSFLLQINPKYDIVI